MRQNIPTRKVFYRPIEAAIRWAGLLQDEQAILAAHQSHQTLPVTLDCPRRERLQLCLARIYDGIFNGDLPYGENGITCNDPALFDSPTLTVRHVDLKAWMRTYYPEQRPAFLFTRSERSAHPTITIETAQAMLAERHAVRLELKQCRRQLAAFSKQTGSPVNPSSLTERAELTYLHIIGALLGLFLGESPSGEPYSMFRTQEALVSALVTDYGGIMGMSERTLNGKFAKAKKLLPGAIS